MNAELIIHYVVKVKKSVGKNNLRVTEHIKTTITLTSYAYIMSTILYKPCDHFSCIFKEFYN